MGQPHLLYFFGGTMEKAIVSAWECPYCKSESTKLVFGNGESIGYKRFIEDKSLHKIFDNRPASHMKCMECGRRSRLNWTKGIPPYGQKL